MTDVRVPKLNNNDEHYTLVEWLLPDGAPVAAEQVIATLETAKAVEDLVCPAAGTLWQMASAGAQYAPGQVIAQVLAPGTPRPAPSAAPTALPAEGGPGISELGPPPVITEPARAFMAEHGIDPAQVHALGLRLVRRSDVERMLAAADEPRSTPATGPDRDDGDGNGRITLSAQQQAVARAVTRSHQSVPAAYTVIRVDTHAAEITVHRLAARMRRPVGVPELLVAAVAPLYEEFPLCFASPLDQDSVRPPDGAHIGLALDTGNGLLVPVVRAAERLSVEEIVEVVGGYRLAAMRGALRERDLVGGNLTVSLDHEPDVVMTVPIILPGQTCVLTLAGSRAELALADDGTVVSRTVGNLGLAYDHRYVNGRTAAMFLRRIKQRLETWDE